MSDHIQPSGGLAEVERLTAELTDRILDAQIMKRPVPADQTQALAKAAYLLHDNDLPWPPMLDQVLHELMQDRNAQDREQVPGSSAETSEDPELRGLARLFGALRRDKSRDV